MYGGLIQKTDTVQKSKLNHILSHEIDVEILKNKWQIQSCNIYMDNTSWPRYLSRKSSMGSTLKNESM